MIISHVKIIAFQTIINHSLCIFYVGRKDDSFYNKQKNTRVLGNTRFISRIKDDICMYLYHAQKKLPFFAKIVAKMVAFPRVIQIYTKFASVTRLYFPYLTTFLPPNFAILLILGSSF